MISIYSKNRLLSAVALIMILGTSVISVSKNANINNGIGRIIAGEELPYQDESGYKNPVTDSVKLTEMEEWETFSFRAFLPKKIQDIKHDTRIILFYMEGIGGDAAAFNKERGGAMTNWTFRKDDSGDYGKRDEWGKVWELSEGVHLYRYTNKKFKVSDPKTFTWGSKDGTSGDLGESFMLTTNMLREWKEKYDLTAIKVTMQVYTVCIVKEWEKADSEEVLEVQNDGTLKKKNKVTGFQKYVLWDSCKFWAEGRFTLELDNPSKTKAFFNKAKGFIE